MKPRSNFSTLKSLYEGKLKENSTDTFYWVTTMCQTLGRGVHSTGNLLDVSQPLHEYGRLILKITVEYPGAKNLRHLPKDAQAGSGGARTGGVRYLNSPLLRVLHSQYSPLPRENGISFANPGSLTPGFSATSL